MATILGTHSEIYVPKVETGMFLTNRVGFGGYRLAQRYNKVAREVHESGKPFLIEKTPKHIRKLPMIRRNFPNSKFVMPVRDGRDIVASLYKRTNDLSDSIARWKEDTSRVAKEMTKPDVLVYRHEDLITDTNGTLERICEFLEVEFEPGILNYHEQETLWHKHTELKATDQRGGSHHNVNRNWQVNQPIHDTRGRWREILSAEYLTEVTTGSGRYLMELFDYDCDDS